MERTVWTDERLDDRFDRIDSEIRDLRTDIRDLRMLTFQLWGSTMVGILATIGTVIATRT